MKSADGLHVLLVIAISFGVVQTAASQITCQSGSTRCPSGTRQSVCCRTRRKVREFMSDDYLQTDVEGNIQDKQAWLNEYDRPIPIYARSRRLRNKWSIAHRLNLSVESTVFV